jgi:glycerol-3-phosphate dehydrogenase
MAEDTIDTICRTNGSHHKRDLTTKYRISGSEGFSEDQWQILKDKYHLPENVCRYLSRTYGSRSRDVAFLILEDKLLSETLSPGYPFIAAEVVYAVRHEMAYTLADVLGRRVRVETVDLNCAMSVAPRVALLMAQELYWTKEETTVALSEYLDDIEKRMQYDGE